MSIGDFYVHVYDSVRHCGSGTLCYTKEDAKNCYTQFCEENKDNPNISVYVTQIDRIYYDYDGECDYIDEHEVDIENL